MQPSKENMKLAEKENGITAQWDVNRRGEKKGKKKKEYNKKGTG